MDDQPQSLIIQQEQAAGMQPVLFDLPAEVQEKLAVEGRYTADRLWRDRPEMYKTIVTMLAEKRGIRAIKRACRVHHETIKAVAARERLAIDTEKERIISDLQAAAMVGAERLVEVMEVIKPEYLGTAVGITIDKLLLLSGEATARIETVSQRADAPKTWDEWLEKLKPAQGREITGCEGEGSGEMGGDGGSGAGAGVGSSGAVVVHVLGGAADRQSDVSRQERQDATVDATADAVENLGGEGVAFRERGADSSTD